MLVKLAANKTVSETATALQTAVQFHNKNCWSVKTRSKHRGARAISVDGRAKKMTGDSNEATRTRDKK